MRGQWTCLNGPTASNCLNREGPATVRDDARLIVWGDDFPKALQAAHKAATFVCFVILETCVLFDVFFLSRQIVLLHVSCLSYLVFVFASNPCTACWWPLITAFGPCPQARQSCRLFDQLFDRWSNKSSNSGSFHSLSPLVKLDVKQKESSLKTGCIWFSMKPEMAAFAVAEKRTVERN